MINVHWSPYLSFLFVCQNTLRLILATSLAENDGIELLEYLLLLELDSFLEKNLEKIELLELLE